MVSEIDAGNGKMRCELPIGVFDSGVGGISVLRELVALMPNENYIFYGDSAHAPYGTKSLEEVRRLTFADAEFLMQMGVKALVVACNTATSAAVKLLRERYADLPVIGIEPALKPAVRAAEHARILVLATPMTLREDKFCELMHRFEKEAEILTLPCPGLGCTHYPFVKPVIQKVLGADVRIFDGGEGTARETKRRLAESGLLNPSGQRGEVALYNSLASEETMQLARRLLGPL